MHFKKVEVSDIESVKELADLAAGIIKEHFDPIIGEKQNDYMIAKFQTAEAITEQINDGLSYYFVQSDEAENIGFLAFKPQEDKMYLSKFYLIKEERGKGFSRKMLNYVIAEAEKLGLEYIYLNVNKNNNAIKAYESLGFEKFGERKKDIGNGFYMDDYVYRYEV